jgi:hypothetical protein
VPNHQVHFNRAEHSEEELQGSGSRWAPLGVAMTTVCLNHFGAACTSSFSIGKLGGPPRIRQRDIRVSRGVPQSKTPPLNVGDVHPRRV